MSKLIELRKKHPQYKNVQDEELKKLLYKQFYSSMTFAEFEKKLAGDVPKHEEKIVVVQQKDNSDTVALTSAIEKLSKANTQTNETLVKKLDEIIEKKVSVSEPKSKKPEISIDNVIKHLINLTSESNASVEMTTRAIGNVLTDLKTIQMQYERTMQSVLESNRKPLNLKVKFRRDGSKLIKEAKVKEI